jgi:hypothetical protein
MTGNPAAGDADSHARQASTDHRPGHNPGVIVPMESTLFARSDPAALADLQAHWGSAYEIGLDGNIWSATFRGTADDLRAHTCMELRALIRADYSYRQQVDSYRQQVDPAQRSPRRADPEERDADRPASYPSSARQDSSAGGGGVIRGERMSL